MKLLDKTIISPKTLKGFTLEQVYMDDEYYIYKKHHTKDKYEAGYELFERRINTMFQCESVPGAESFGIWAWQLRTLNEAKIKLQECKNKQ